MSQTSTDLDPQTRQGAEFGADTLLDRLAPARPVPSATGAGSATASGSAPAAVLTGPRPLRIRELAAGAVGATVGALLVVAGVALALAGAWAALTGSEILFWNWSEPSPVAAVALVVLGVPVAVYAACTIWLCVLFLPLLTFRLVRGLLHRH